MPPKKKKVTGLIKLQINAGAANPAPPVGPALGQHGVNIMEFCKAYNAATESQRGWSIPVEITVYEDRSFTFITKTPPAAKTDPQGRGCREGLRRAAQDQGRQDHPGAGPRDRHDQAARPQRQRPGRRVEDHRRHRPFHGHHGRGLSPSLVALRSTWQGLLGPYHDSSEHIRSSSEQAQQVSPRCGRQDRPGASSTPRSRPSVSPRRPPRPSSTAPSRSPSAWVSTRARPTRWSVAP